MKMTKLNLFLFIFFIIIVIFSCTFTKKELILHNSKIEYTKLLEELIQDYTKDHKNVTIKIFEERNDAINLLSVRLFNKEKIDLYFLPSYRDYYEFINKGYVYGYEKKPKWLEKIADEYRKTITKDGVVYGFPFDVSCFGVIYNKNIFDKYKVGVPKSFENLENISKSLKDQNIQPIASAISDGWVLPMIFYSGFKSVISNEEVWLQSMKNKIGTFNIENSIFVKDFFDYYKKYGGNDFLKSNFSTQIEKMAKEEAAFAFLNIFNRKTIKLRNQNINLGFFPLLFDNKKDNDKIYSDVENILVINKETKNRKEALDFINYLATDNAQRIIITKYSVLTPMKYQTVDEPFLNDIYKYIYENKINLYIHKKIPLQVYENTRDQLLKYLNNEKSFQESLIELDKIWRKID